MKRNLVFLFCFFISVFLSAEKLAVSPFLYVNDSDTDFVKKEENMSYKIYEVLLKSEISEYLTITWLKDSEYNKVYGLSDAARIASGNFRYVLYGYLRKNENYDFCSVKIYDGEQRKIVREFVCAETSEYSGRMETLLESDVLMWFCEILGIKTPVEIKPLVPSELSLGLSACCWFPLTECWQENLLGIAGASLFLDYSLPLCADKKTFPVFGIGIKTGAEYLYGSGWENPYINDWQRISGKLSGCGKLWISKNNCFLFQSGFLFEYEILNYMEKYDNRDFECQFMPGLSFALGYEVDLSKKIKFFCFTESDFHLSNDYFVILKSDLGIKMNLLKN